MLVVGNVNKNMTEIEIYLKNLSDIQSIKSEYPKYNEVELDNYDSMINSVEIFYPRNTIEKNEQKKLSYPRTP